MLIPISWLKEYVDIKLPLKDLMWKMTEAGLTCESTKKVDDEIILDVEVTANRPDWMSVVGVAREVGAIQGIKIKEFENKLLASRKNEFPVKLIGDFKYYDRWSAILIKDVKITNSPKWLQEKIKWMGHGPINNIIDITNYVMYELGIPMHAFDYDKIKGQVMSVGVTKGGEEFTSVDNISYKLPKDAMIISDSDKIIDLVGIKGGLNSGITNSTKNVLLHVMVDNPVLIRRTSIALGLFSEASIIYQRGPDKGGTIKSLTRATNLILELAGGKIASKLIDIKKEKYEPKKISLSTSKLKRVLGIELKSAQVLKILTSLNLNPITTKEGFTCTIPTYRGDIKIEEDLAEEVARLYGYNNFPKTIPTGQVDVGQIPYYFDDSFILKLKDMLVASGYSEAKTLTLFSKEVVDNFLIDPNKLIKITNPVSLEYEYMRPSLVPNLISAVKTSESEIIKLFEIDKVYTKVNNNFLEKYNISGITTNLNFRDFKSTIDLTFKMLNINHVSIEFDTNKKYYHPSSAGTIKIGESMVGEFGKISPEVLSNLGLKDNIYCFEFDIDILEKLSSNNIFSIVPTNPPQIEDITLILPPKTRVGEIINHIYSQNKLVSRIELIDIYKDAFTFKIYYQDPQKTLTNIEVEKIRNTFLTSLKNNFGIIAKE